MNYRPLGNTGIQISEMTLGCWPIAGLTSPGANDQDSLATIRACFELGINHLDTAYRYGLDGESEKLIGQALAGRRHEMVIATKGGLHWGPDRKQAHDASPATLRRQVDRALTDRGTPEVGLPV
jgi:aryl-alcohol dehydrogenase-like predicted oxidoreductase